MFSLLRLRYYDIIQEPVGIGTKTYYRGRIALNFYHLMYQITPNVKPVDTSELRDKLIPRILQGNNDYVNYYSGQCSFNLSDISNFPSYYVFHTLLSVYDKKNFRVIDEHLDNERARLLAEILSTGNSRIWLTNIE